MKDFVDGSAFNNEQGNRARKLFAAVVLAALDDAIADDKKSLSSSVSITSWIASGIGVGLIYSSGTKDNRAAGSIFD